MPVFECVICTAVQRKCQSLKKGGVAPPYTGFALFRQNALDAGLSAAFFRTMTCMDAPFKTTCQASDPLILVLRFRVEKWLVFLNLLHCCCSQGKKVVFDPLVFSTPALRLFRLRSCRKHSCSITANHPTHAKTPPLQAGFATTMCATAVHRDTLRLYTRTTLACTALRLVLYVLGRTIMPAVALVAAARRSTLLWCLRLVGVGGCRLVAVE